MEGSESKQVGAPDPDTIYRELGRFVVFFQVLENQLFQLASFALDPDHAGRGRRETADLWFKTLVDTTSLSVGAFLAEHRGEEPEFRERLEALLGECRELARYRNKVLHSAYVFLERDGKLNEILRSDITKGVEPGEVELDQESLSENTFDEATGKTVEVALALGQCRLQLIAWYRPRHV
jgi:hypothetical protein